MGWTSFSGMSRKRDLIKHIVEHEMVPHHVHKYCVRGDTLWMVCSYLDNPKYIACILLGKCEGDWGYKDMCESMGPYRYHCPLSYLDMVPEVTNAEWREEVRKHHAIVKSKAWSLNGRIYRWAKSYTEEVVRKHFEDLLGTNQFVLEAVK
jgi:hypothetical protein